VSSPNHGGPIDRPIGVGAAVDRLGVSASWVRALADAGRLPFTTTTGGHRRFLPADVEHLRLELLAEKHWSRRYDVDDLEEHLVWADVQAALRLSGRAQAVARYAVTEMVNNAIDHSGGSIVAVDATLDELGRAIVTITDDGSGVFHTVASGFQLASDVEALAELTKGKRTTDPERHTGEGIFFTSKAVALFDIAANGLQLSFDNVRSDFAFGVSDVTAGTRVTLTVDPETTVELQMLFERFTENFEFTRSRPVIKLFELGLSFVSRSEAKRVAQGLDAFSAVELDFAKVDSIGQGFADELFRVWAGAHPDTELLPVEMNPAVAFMVERARRRG
jgi:excisionase family DNA binding protein